MKKFKISGVTSVVTAFMLSFSMFKTGTAAAFSNGKITVECGKSDIVWDLYKIGVPQTDGNINLAGDFKELDVPSSTGYKDEFQAFSGTVENYISIYNPSPVNSGTADSAGSVIFSGIDEGWYIVVPERLVTDDKIYTSSPVIVCITDKQGYVSLWSTDVTVQPKVDGQDVTASNDKDIVIKFEWPDEDNYIRPQEPIEIIIYRDGQPYQTIILDEENDWTYILPSVPDDDTEWSVAQKDYPDTIIPIYKNDTVVDDDKPVDIFIIQNIINPDSPVPPTTDVIVTEVTTTAPEEEESNSNNSASVTSALPVTQAPATVTSAEIKLPQTGQMWWPVPVLSVAGVAFIAAGYASSKNKKD